MKLFRFWSIFISFLLSATLVHAQADITPANLRIGQICSTITDGTDHMICLDSGNGAFYQCRSSDGTCGVPVNTGGWGYNNNTTTTNYNVGIGTTTPSASLVVATGNVGIGILTPLETLTVDGNVGIGDGTSKNLQLRFNNSGSSIRPTWSAASNGISTFSTTYGSDNSSRIPWQFSTSGHTSTGGFTVIGLRGTASAGDTGTASLVLGAQGIGTSTANSGILERLIGLSGGASLTGTGTVTDAYGVYGTAPTTTTGTITRSYAGMFNGRVGAAGGVGIGTSLTSSYIQTAPPTGGLLVEGNVGIGVLNPTAGLHVATGLITNTLNIPGSTAGHVWTATDSLGNGGWAAPTGGSGGGSTAAGWSDIGAYVHTTSLTDQVAIGTTTPGASLEIVKKVSTAPLMVSATHTSKGDYLIITSSGNVGIGTTLPTNPLSIDGNANVTGNLSVGLLNTAPSDDPTSIYNVQTAGDIDYWAGVQSNNNSTADTGDAYQIGSGAVPGVGTMFSLSSTGDLILGNTLDTTLTLTLRGGATTSLLQTMTLSGANAAIAYTNLSRAAATSAVNLFSLTGTLNNVTGVVSTPVSISSAFRSSVTLAGTSPTGVGFSAVTGITSMTNTSGTQSEVRGIYGGGTRNAAGGTTTTFYGLYGEKAAIPAGTLSNNYALGMDGRSRYLVDAQSIPNSGSVDPALFTLTPASGYVELTCLDADGCTVSLGEVGVLEGTPVTIVNVTGNACTFEDVAGVSELSGAGFAAGIYDVLNVVYLGDRWVESSRSDN